MSFARNTNATDAEILVEGTPTLTNGTEWTGLATNSGGSWGGDTNVVEAGTGTPVRVSVQGAGGTSLFLRLRVSAP